MAVAALGRPGWLLIIEDADVVRLQPPVALQDAKRDLGTRAHPQSAIGDLIGMHENILATIAGRDESVALDLIKANDPTGNHNDASPANRDHDAARDHNHTT